MRSPFWYSTELNVSICYVVPEAFRTVRHVHVGNEEFAFSGVLSW